ncbi:hypothetical protein CONPUDRAFT_138563 [Coniophora puteana RWD-64-598 SS2]|uniref:F-box domain-containing protein n=1 Tax=Coniophora puteana (strain RWD-64-598) TaxID=741705 RepID=A0A5M3MGM7_CONPW|nr:uncharacterized protein CONPUDRAFT_138563 [Coniophora puteana RWD-64-598 SS2]EIW78146.1 hypothetical protein CONPUDRAFT_138563 [Coniophora puteana RWD-64-598 SS2]
MHKCLRVDELLREICQTVLHSHPDNQQTLNTGDLARLARVCRQFQDPALDTLWWAQDTIGPLFLCAPEDMRHVDCKNIVKLSRTSRPSDWERVKVYGRRIRCIGNPQFPVGSFPFRQARPMLPDAAILDAMLVHCAIEDVFPNLLAFDFMSAVGYRCVNSNFHSLKHFLTPMLRQLSFSIVRVSLEFVQYIIDSLQTRCPDLELLSISPGYRSPPASLRIPDGTLRTLRSLSLPLQDVHLSPETLAKLAASPRIRKLSCTLEDTFDAQAFARTRGTGASCMHSTPQARFSGLEHLSIRASRPDQWTDFLRALHMPNLEGLQVQFTAAHTPSAIDLASIRAACPNPASLRALSIVRVISVMDDGLPTVSPAAFAPLFAFHNLKNVHIANVGNLDMTDAFVADVAAAWPLLEELAFVLSVPGAPRLTLRALVPLARHCRNLKRLYMPFDGTVVTHEDRLLSAGHHNDDAIPNLEVHLDDDDSEAEDADAGPQYVLRELNVGSTPISSPVDVAMFIFGLFPWASIRVIPQTEQMDKSWKRAITHFKVMQGKDAPDTPLY